MIFELYELFKDICETESEGQLQLIYDSHPSIYHDGSQYVRIDYFDIDLMFTNFIGRKDKTRFSWGLVDGEKKIAKMAYRTSNKFNYENLIINLANPRQIEIFCKLMQKCGEINKSRNVFRLKIMQIIGMVAILGFAAAYKVQPFELPFSWITIFPVSIGVLLAIYLSSDDIINMRIYRAIAEADNK